METKQTPENELAAHELKEPVQQEYEWHPLWLGLGAGVQTLFGIAGAIGKGALWCLAVAMWVLPTYGFMYAMWRSDEIGVLAFVIAIYAISAVLVALCVCYDTSSLLGSIKECRNRIKPAGVIDIDLSTLWIHIIWLSPLNMLMLWLTATLFAVEQCLK